MIDIVNAAGRSTNYRTDIFFLGRGGGVILLAINCHLVKEKFNILAVKFLCFPIFLYRTLIDIGF